MPKDIFAIVPFYVLIILKIDPDENWAVEGIQLLAPVLRLLKIARHSTGWRLLVVSISECISALTVPAFLLLLMTVFSSCLIYWLEKTFECKQGPECAPEKLRAFNSIPHAMWFSVVTIATVGYGDVVPHTGPGKIASAALILTGICYMAMPLAIIGQQVTKVWDDRDRILMRQKVKLRLFAGGIATREQLLELFGAADEDGSGSVGRYEFCAMVDSFDLGFSQAQINRIFRAVDEDHSGVITFEEFVAWLFPEVHEQEEEEEMTQPQIRLHQDGKTQQALADVAILSEEPFHHACIPARRTSTISERPSRLEISTAERLNRIEKEMAEMRAVVKSLPDMLRQALAESAYGMSV